MKTTLLTTDTELEGSIGQYLDKKLAAIARLVDSNDDSALAAIEIERTTRHHKKGLLYRAEVNLRTAAHGVQRAEGFGETFEQAIDEMKDDILQELRRAKGKSIAKTRSGAREIKRRIAGGA
jgi:ribosome-associated translation inhibitor RaiA